MIASVTLTPVGRAEQVPVLVSEPTYSETAQGGSSTATVVCVPERDFDRIAGADVRIEPPAGESWCGTVASYESDRGVFTLNCVGKQFDLSGIPHAATYCALSGWEAFTTQVAGRTDDIAVSVGEELVARFSAGTPYTWQWNGWLIEFPSTGTVRIAGDWSRTSQAYPVYLELYGDGVTYSPRQLLVPARSNGFSGSFDVTVSQAATLGAGIRVYSLSPHTPPVEQTVTLSNVRLYAVDGLTAAVTPSGVINDIFDSVPSWYLPTGAKYRYWISTDAGPKVADAAFDSDDFDADDFDTTDRYGLEPLVFDHRVTASRALEDTVSYRDYDISLRPRLVDGQNVCVPVYEQRSATPAYYVDVTDDGVEADLTGETIAEVYDIIRVSYTTSTGSHYVDVTDDSHDNYRTAIGRSRTRFMDIGAASYALAVEMGERALDEQRRPVTGSVTISRPLADASGAEVLPTQVKAGKWIRLYGTNRGSVEARITEAEKEGQTVRVMLTNSPTRLDTELATLAKLREA